MSLCDELLSQQQEIINPFIRSLEEEISQNSQQVQRLMAEQSSSNLPKSILGQVEFLIKNEHQNASKLQILEEINREATEILEEQHCRLEEARLNLTTPLTSEAEASEPESCSGARPNITLRASLTSAAPGVLSQEAVAQAYSSHSNLPQVPDMLIAGGGHGHKVTLRSPVVRPGSISSTPCLVPQPVSFNVSRIPNIQIFGKDMDSEVKVRPETPCQKVKRMAKMLPSHHMVYSSQLKN